MQEIINTLLSDENVAGLWAVIGAISAAFITFLGIFANNFFENKRRKKEREHTLIKDAYYGVVEYISYTYHKIASVGKDWTSFGSDVDSSLSEKYYKLYLVGSSEVINKFSEYSQKNSRVMFQLIGHISNLQRLNAEKERYKDMVDNSLKLIDEIVLQKQAYNEKKLNNQALWDLYNDQYCQYQEQYENYANKWDDSEARFLEAYIILIKESFKALLETSTDMYDVIFLMRKDLDRKLSKKDALNIKNSLDAVLKELKTNIKAMIDKLEADLKNLETEE